MNNIIKLIVVAAVAFTIVGCSQGTSAEDAKVNADVGSGEMPAKLQGADSAGGGGGNAPETPNTSPD
ncbi:MAG: hypothetical protein KF836_13985 [Fimbriimonadaceae bacterium]|nr:hypothetical protein [Fimbriimonadaceae bacterium]MBX3115670.1 hypothetical protein [Fimbriimonadaceae bacterium]